MAVQEAVRVAGYAEGRPESAGHPGDASGRRAIRPEDLLHLRWTGDLTLAPDGQTVVFVEHRVDAEKNGYRTRLMRVRPGEEPMPLTQGEHDGHPRFSPDGQWLGFLAKRGPFTQLWVLPTAGGEARPLTAVLGGVSDFAWSPDGRRVALLADLDGRGLLHAGEGTEEDEDADPKGKPQARGGAQDAASDAQRPAPLGGLPEDPADLAALYGKYNRDVKVITELTYKLDGVGYFRARRPQVCVLDVAVALASEEGLPAPPGSTAGGGGAAIEGSVWEVPGLRVLTRGPYQMSGLHWSPDGRFLLTTSNMEPDYDRRAWEQHVYRIAVDASPDEPQTVRLSPGEGLMAEGGIYDPTGGRIAFLGSWKKATGYDNVEVYVADANGGAPVSVTHALDRPFVDLALADVKGSGQNGLTWSRDGARIYGIVSDHGATYLAAVDLASGSVERVTHGDRTVYAYALSADGRTVALGVGTPTSPGDVYLLDLSTGRETRCSDVNRALFARVAVLEPRRFTARADDGVELDGWVLEPYGREPGRRYPALLEVHGGPMMMYAQAFFLEFQVLAAAGYAVIYGNPRGSQGYGQDFCMAIQFRWGDRDYQDVLTLLDTALAREPWLDPDRLGVLGGSYGGYMTNWIVGHTDRFKAAATMRSVVEWGTMMGTSDGGPEWAERAGGQPPWREDDWYRQQSPLTYVDHITTPLLIEHQEGDLRCPIEQGEMLYTAVRWLGKAPVRFVRYPGEFHGMSRGGKPFHRIHRLRQLLDWFAPYLGGAAPVLHTADRPFAVRSRQA